MGEGRVDSKHLKSPKKSRPSVDGPRVHFQAPPIPPKKPILSSKPDTTKVDVKTSQEEYKHTQPSSFPAVGAAPGSGFPGGQWHTSSDPTRSLGSGPRAYNSPQAFPYQHLACFGASPNQQSLQTAMAADYANAAPPPTGVNFQPPVPDTTYGPMLHTFVPRHDGPGANMMPGTYYVGQPVPSGVQQPGYVYVGQPPMIQQPIMGQQAPIMINGQAYVPAVGGQQFQPVAGGQPMPMGVGGVPFIAGNAGPAPPDVTGMGRTPNEEILRQIDFAHKNGLYERQDFKPADDDPSRFYFVREVDGNWTQRSRFSIDHMGDCRWFVTEDGWFYAVRQPS